MKFKIICDSSCDLNSDYLKEEFNDDSVELGIVPFIVAIEGDEYIDGTCNEGIILECDSKKSTRSSCPAPGACLNECTAEYNFIITISSKLSGSYNSALSIVDECDKKIFVIDSKGTGGIEQLLVDKLYELIKEGNDFETIKKKIIQYRDKRELYFSLSSFDNLVKKGRIKASLAAILKSLKLSFLCMANDGEISLHKKCVSFRQSLIHIAILIRNKRMQMKKCIITYTDNYEDALFLKEKLEKSIIFEKIVLVKARLLNSFYILKKGIIVSY